MILLLETILTNLTSESSDQILKALDFCIVDESLLVNKEVINKIFNLLNHENYYVRNQAEKVLSFYIEYSSESKEHLMKLLVKVFDNKEIKQDLWFRCTKILFLLPLTESMKSILNGILTSNAIFAQGVLIFLLKNLCEKYPELLSGILEILVNQDSDVKKGICMIFWKKPHFLSSQAIDVFSILSKDENREVRRLACEILNQMLNFDQYRHDIGKILECRLLDPSWRVQKIALKSMVTYGFLDNQETWDKVIGLFWHPEWRVRKNICETLPILQSLKEQKNKITVEALLAALDDPNWEVRESAAISLNHHLDLDKDEFKDVLIKISEKTTDMHEQVRRTACNIISKRYDAFKERKEDIFRKIIWLLEDPKKLVSNEALNNLLSLLNVPNYDKYFPTTFSSILKLLSESDNNVREKAWLLLKKTELSDKQYQIFISELITLFNHPNPDVRLKACEFLHEDIEFWRTNQNIILLSFTTLLEDENSKVLSKAWNLVTRNKEVFSYISEFIFQLSENLEDIDSRVAIFVCETYHKYNLINGNEIILDQFIRILSRKNIPRELKKKILIILTTQGLLNFLQPQLISQLIEEGQWDVQEMLIPFLIHFLIEDSRNELKEIDFQNMIIGLLREPTSKNAQTFHTSSQPIHVLFESLEKDLLEFNVEEFLFNSINDDKRLEKWLNLERKFDFIQKINHPQLDEIEIKFKERILNQIKQGIDRFGFMEIFRSDIGLSTPLRIVNLMRRQQESIRIKLLIEIDKRVDLSVLQFNKLKEAILTSVNDNSFKIRTISWNIIQYNLFKIKELDSKILSVITTSLNSIYDDTRAKAVSLLLSCINIKDLEHETIFNQIINKLEDQNPLVRDQVWQLLDTKINLSFSRYSPITMKILDLLSNPNVNIRKEAYFFLERNLEMFISIIENYPQPPEVYHALGFIYNQKGNNIKAEEMFEKAISINPSELNSMLATALIHLDKREPEKTVQILKEAQQVNPLDFRIYQIWSECLSGLGNDDEAKKLEEKAKFLKLNQQII
ncbi:MAG: HEAT repeat domain-containing protein [Promethearchaeota archaeon]